MKSTVKKLCGVIPLTVKGVLILWFTYVCIYTYGIKESDLVASIVGSILLILLSFSFLVSAYSYIKIRKRLQLEQLGSNTDLLSNIPNSLSIRLFNFRIPPLFVLRIKRVFDESTTLESNKKIILSNFECSGSFISPQNLSGQIQFPHRGVYTQLAFQFSLMDFLGLFKWTWSKDFNLSFSVYPQDKQIEALPVMLASSVSGDLTSATDIRSGDLFDSKQYQTGDSLKRVLWKVYARSQDLIVRHPEPAIIPEGEMVSYSIALPEEDDVVSANIAYLRMVSSQNLKFIASNLGAKSDIATTIDQALNLNLQFPLTLDTHSALKEFANYLDHLKENNSQVFELIIFCPSYSHSPSKRQLQCYDILKAICHYAEELNIKVHLAKVSTEQSTHNTIHLNEPNTHQVKFLES